MPGDLDKYVVPMAITVEDVDQPVVLGIEDRKSKMLTAKFLQRGMIVSRVWKAGQLIGVCVVEDVSVFWVHRKQGVGEEQIENQQGGSVDDRQPKDEFIVQEQGAGQRILDGDGRMECKVVSAFPGCFDAGCLGNRQADIFRLKHGTPKARGR